jgi:hypothetical protein
LETPKGTAFSWESTNSLLKRLVATTQPWKRRLYTPPKRITFSELYGVKTWSLSREPQVQLIFMLILETFFPTYWVFLLSIDIRKKGLAYPI